MSTQAVSLPTEGFIRQPDLIGVEPVSQQQAKQNRRDGRSPVRPRDGRPGVVPFSSATLWRKIKAGEFPKPVKLSAGVTAWDVQVVRDWLAKRQAA